jgi:CRP-like cAMP-binding protein
MTAEFERPAFRAELKRQALFSGFSDDDLDEILSGGIVRSLNARHVLFLEGDTGNAVYIVLEGQVKVSVHSGQRREVILNIAGPGELIGEIAVLDGGPRTAAAMTLEPVKLLHLGRESIMPVLERNPAAMLKILRLLCTRLRTTNQMVEEILFHSGASRLARAILRLAESHGLAEAEGCCRIPLHLPHTALGAQAGLHRESVGRQLRAWENAGVLVSDSDGLLLYQRDILEQVSLHEGGMAGRTRQHPIFEANATH